MALVSRWTLEGNATDSVGSNNGTESGTIVYGKSCVLGTKSLLCDGGADYISLGSFRFSSPTNYSISVWFKLKLNIAGTTCIVSDTHSSDTTLIRIATSGGRLYYQVFNNGSTLFNVGTTLATYNDDLWHHFIVCDANGIVTSYFDGSSCNIAGNYTKPSFTLDSSSIGADLRSTPTYYEGNIDDIRYYTHILTQDEVTLIWLDRLPRWQTPHHRYKLESNTNDTIETLNATGSNITFLKYPKISNIGSSYFNGATGIGGSNAYVAIDGLNDNAYTNFTISTWVYSKNETTSPEPIFYFALNNSDYYRTLLQKADSSNVLIFSIILNGSWNATTCSKIIFDGKWHFVAFTASGNPSTTGAVYVDGVLDTPISYTRDSTIHTLTTIGALRFNTYNPYPDQLLKGNIYDWRFYGVALTASEVKSLYQSYFTEKAVNFIGNMI